MGLWHTRWEPILASSPTRLAAWCHLYLGHPDRALAESEEALALAKRVEHPISLAAALSRLDLSMASAARSTGRGNVPKKSWFSPSGSGFRLPGTGKVFARLRPGRIGGGQGGYRGDAAGAGRASWDRERDRSASFLFFLAEGLRKVGRHDDALGALALGVARAEQQGQHYYDAELHRLRAEILLDMDGNAVEEAEALFRQSLEIARRQEAKTFELRAATSLARLWRRQGKRDAAQALLAPLYAWFTEGFDTRDLKDAKTLLEELS